jgi:hypothetical protein
MVEWGTVPDWIAAVSTYFALIGAAVAVYYTHAASKREEARDNRYEEAQRRAQADQVATWIEDRLDADTNSSAGVAYRNISSLPVYGVVVYTWGRTGTQDPLIQRWAFDIGTLPPGASEWIELDDQPGDEQRSDISFVDSSNRAWHRDQYGVLTQGDDPNANDLRFTFALY